MLEGAKVLEERVAVRKEPTAVGRRSDAAQRLTGGLVVRHVEADREQLGARCLERVRRRHLVATQVVVVAAVGEQHDDLPKPRVRRGGAVRAAEDLRGARLDVLAREGVPRRVERVL